MAAAPRALAQQPNARNEPVAWRMDVDISGSTTSEKGVITPDSLISGHGVVRGLEARFDIARSNDPELRAGGWVLSSDGGRTLLAVDPMARRFSVMQNATSLRQFAESKWITISVTGLTTRADTIGPCGSIDGHPTVCYRFVREYAMRVRYFLITQRTQVREEVQFWVADDLPGLVNPAATFLTDVAGLGSDNPAAVLHAQQTLSRLFHGVPIQLVRTDSEWKSADRRGTASVSTTTMRFRNIARTTVDDAQFRLPTDFRLRTR